MSKKASEETTKGMVADRLKDIDGYPTTQNVCVDGITWFKEDSYKGTAYDWLSGVFSTATKKQSGKDKGTPDFIITKDNSNVIIVIECKGNEKDHSKYSDVKEYKLNGFGDAIDTTDRKSVV